MDPTSNISRWVTFLITPAVLLVSGFIALKANTWFGLHLEPAEVASYVFGVVLGLGGLAITWLRNRGKYELHHLTGASESDIEEIARQVVAKLPPAPTAPQAPAPGVAGAPAQPQAPPQP